MEEAEQEEDFGTDTTSENEDDEVPELSDDKSGHIDVSKNRPSGAAEASV